MTHSFESSRRIARLRVTVFAALILALTGCGDPDAFDPDSGTPTEDESGLQAAPVDDPELASASFAGGIPIGVFAQPITLYGSLFNGGHKNIAPQLLVRELAAIKARGGKVVLMFAGNERYYKEGGHFSLSKWKARVNRFRGVNFTSYLNDGTIIGHFLLDEPNDPANWRGKPVRPSVVEEMARYSKQLWPKMATIVRVEPGYLAGNHRYLDAAWAQYLSRKGNPNTYIRRHVAEAQKRRLGLVVGLNIIHGGTPTGRQMTASQVESWGSALLSSAYPCAFISWQYNARFLSSKGVKGAMTALRRKAQGRNFKGCRGS